MRQIESGELGPIMLQEGRLVMPGLEADLSVYRNKNELDLYKAIVGEFQQILPASKQLPPPFSLTQRSRGIRVGGVRGAIRTEDAVGSERMNEDEIRIKAMGGKLIQQHKLFLPAEFEGGYKKGNIVFSARCPYFIGGGGIKVPYYAYADAKVFIYHFDEKIKPAVLSPDRSDRSKLSFGLGVEVLKLVNASRA